MNILIDLKERAMFIKFAQEEETTASHKLRKYIKKCNKESLRKKDDEAKI